MKHIVGDILKNVKSGIIVHGCNAQSVMGGGIALQIKQKYPQAYQDYKTGLESCVNLKMNPLGKIFVSHIEGDLYIANAITQNQFGTNRRQVDYEALARCFEQISKVRPSIPIHYPLIGAGLAGGNWTIISTIIDETLQGHDHTLWTLK